MKNITHKIILGFIIFVSILALVGYARAGTNKEELKTSLHEENQELRQTVEIHLATYQAFQKQIDTHERMIGERIRRNSELYNAIDDFRLE